MTAVIGGQIDAAVGGVGEVASAAEQGQLRPLAIFHSERHPDIPDVPTAAEAGYPLEFGDWGGIYAPKDLPDDIRDTLEKAIKDWISSAWAGDGHRHGWSRRDRSRTGTRCSR